MEDEGEGQVDFKEDGRVDFMGDIVEDGMGDIVTIVDMVVIEGEITEDTDNPLCT